jgi:hypothetical protein
MVLRSSCPDRLDLPRRLEALSPEETFFTHKAGRHGQGAVDLPLYNRGPWRRIVGFA